MLSWAASDAYPVFPSARPQVTTIQNQDTYIDEGRDHAEASSSNTELEQNFGKAKASKIKADKMSYEDGEWYDMSLWKAMYHTVKGRFWVATLIEGGGCKLILGCLRPVWSYS
jgi:hypothetical protein